MKLGKLIDLYMNLIEDIQVAEQENNSSLYLSTLDNIDKLIGLEVKILTGDKNE